jgi:SprT protein
MVTSCWLQRAQTETLALLAKAGVDFGIAIPEVAVRFDLRGGAAGQAVFSRCGGIVIRYNRVLLMENGEEFLLRTVPHEVAHVVARLLAGPRSRPHGREWQRVMAHFGAEATRCHRYDIRRTGIRKLQQYAYRCGCREHVLTSIRHGRIQRGQVYLCRYCRKPLRRHRGIDCAVES